MLPAILIAADLLMIALAVPLLLRKVRPNELYGLRVPATFADEWVWYEANARSAVDMILVGSLHITLTLVALLFLAQDSVAYSILTAGGIVVGVLAIAIIGWRRANRLLTARRGS